MGYTAILSRSFGVLALIALCASSHAQTGVRLPDHVKLGEAFLKDPEKSLKSLGQVVKWAVSAPPVQRQESCAHSVTLPVDSQLDLDIARVPPPMANSMPIYRGLPTCKSDSR